MQRDFDGTKDSLSRVIIPNKLKVNDSPRGIGKEGKPALSVITKCASFAEKEDDYVITIPKEDIQNCLLCSLVKLIILKENKQICCKINI